MATSRCQQDRWPGAYRSNQQRILGIARRLASMNTAVAYSHEHDPLSVRVSCILLLDVLASDLEN